MHWSIRFATPADAPAIAGIYAPIVTDTEISFEETPPDAETMAGRISRAMPRHPWLVAEVDSGIVGYASATDFRARPAYRWSTETSVYVASDHRRTGIASALYTELLRVLTAQGFRRAVAGIALPNDASIAAHRRAGFTAMGRAERVGWKHGRWIDMSWWQQDLGDRAEADRPPVGEPRPIRADDIPSP